jgi:hypothetical protein
VVPKASRIPDLTERLYWHATACFEWVCFLIEMLRISAERSVKRRKTAGSRIGGPVGTKLSVIKLTPEEVQAGEEGQGIHVKYVPGTFRPLGNKDNDYLIDREAPDRRSHERKSRGDGQRHHHGPASFDARHESA